MNKTNKSGFIVTLAMMLLGGASVARADHPSISFGAASAGPITTISAATLPQGAKSFGVQVEYVKSGKFSDQQLLNLDAQGIDAHSSDYLLNSSLGFGYGVTDNFTVGVRIPFIERAGLRAVNAGTGNVETLGTSKGLGDATILGKYRAVLNAEHGYQASLLFGVKARTGETDKRDQTGALFTAEHQPGSGSWDPLLGVAASKAIGHTSFDASALYAIAGNGVQDTRLGDRLHYNLSVSWRVGGPEVAHAHHHDLHGDKPHVHGESAIPGAHNPAWDLIMELNGEWQGKQKTAGVTEAYSGGTLAYLSPGVRLSTGNNWAANLSIGIPVVQRLRASHADTDYRVLAGFSLSY